MTVNVTDFLLLLLLVVLLLLLLLLVALFAAAAAAFAFRCCCRHLLLPFGSLSHGVSLLLFRSRASSSYFVPSGTVVRRTVG